ncbi:MAG: transposase [Candidatus Moranbacteria bacterium]|nr:transposase [Candidatus Moranbacteria bacterium]
MLNVDSTGYATNTQALLQTIPKVALITAASLVSEVGNIGKSKDVRRLVAYIGIDPRVYESGASVKGKEYITKRGNKILGTRLYNTVFVVRQRENPFKRFFLKEKSEGKPYILC